MLDKLDVGIRRLSIFTLLLATCVQSAVDLQYCHGGYPGGRCLGNSVSSTAATCFPFDIVTIGAIDTVVGFTGGMKYVLFTGVACNGTSSTAYGSGTNPLKSPFLNNVCSVSIQVSIAPAFKSLGCYTDSGSGRTLAALSDATDTLTVESCQTFCSANNYNYAGVEYGRECYCDLSVRSPGVAANSTTCSSPCSGNGSEICGGVNRINVYWNGKPGPTNPPSIGAGAYSYRGCYTDNINNTRSLPAHYEFKGGATPETCANTCKTNNYTIVGLEYGLECWRGNLLSITSTKIADDNCRIACKANWANWCGDVNHLNLWSTKVL